MHSEFAPYNSVEIRCDLDLWQFKEVLNRLNAEIQNHDFLSDENKNLRRNIENLLLEEVKGWGMRFPPSIEEQKRFMSQLFHHGFPRNIIYEGEDTLLEQVIINDDFEMFTFLIQCCDTVTAWNDKGKLLLQQIQECENLHMFIDILRTRNNLHIIHDHLNMKDVSNMTPLMHAAQKNNVLGVESLILAGASLEEVNAKGETALLIAAKEGHVDIVKQLIQHGAEVNVSTIQGLNLCSFAYEHAEKKHPDLLHDLVENKFDALFDNLPGIPILIHAIKQGYSLDTIRQLLTQERVNKPCLKTGNTPLITACLNRNYDGDDEVSRELIELLLSYGADPLIENKKKKTAISIIQAKYDEDEGEEDACHYNEEIERDVNVLVLKAYDLCVAEASGLSDESEYYDTRIKLKSSALHALQKITDYDDKAYCDAQNKIAMLQFEICEIYLMKFVQGIDDNLEIVIKQFEFFLRDNGDGSVANMANYKKAQFEIASLLITVAAQELDNPEQRKRTLIRALQYADRAQEKSLSNQILNSLTGTTITDELFRFPDKNYMRLSFFADVLKNKTAKIVELQQILMNKDLEIEQLKQKKSSSLGKRSAHSIFAESDAVVNHKKHKDDAVMLPCD